VGMVNGHRFIAIHRYMLWYYAFRNAMRKGL